MHGDIIFQIRDEEVKKTIKGHLTNCEAYTHALEDLAVKASDERTKAWALVYEVMKQESKKMPPGRVYVIDKQARIVDIGPARPANRYVQDEVDSFLDADETEDFLDTIEQS